MSNAPMEPDAGPDATPAADRLDLPDADPGDGHEVIPGLETGDVDAATKRSTPETGGPDTQLSPSKD